MKNGRRIAARRAAETRRFYAIEEECTDPVLLRELPMHRLQALGRRIWEGCGRKGDCPPIVAGRGVEQAGRLLSYYEDGKGGQRVHIMLARNHRCKQVLIHEMVHALGYGTHGIGFQGVYFALVGGYR